MENNRIRRSNPTGFTDQTGTWDYDYDTLNRLAEAKSPNGSVPGQPAGAVYSYDWVGNMKAKSAALPWQYNNADQLLLWPGMHSYAYDNNGALTAVKNPAGTVVQESLYLAGVCNPWSIQNH